jgi:Putative lumazine-binding
MDDTEADVRAIRELVQRQFESMTWAAGANPDVTKFKKDFLADARLYPSARPLAAQSTEAFASRMSELARTSLVSFHERVIGIKIHVFGGVAVAVVVCENTENAAEVNRNVEMMLLVRDRGHWAIVAQAWDKETNAGSIPSELLSNV